MPVHDPSNIGKFAREHFSTALMSDTKWRKLIDAVARADLGVSRMLVKFIDVDKPRKMAFPPSLDCPHAYMDTFEFGPVELRSIEWLEVPVDVEPVVNVLGLYPLERVAGGMRIVGYRR